MRRIVVLGGQGFFGSVIVRRLHEAGLEPHVGSRSGEAGLRVDAENPASIRRALLPGDVVVDAAGPFQDRTAALVNSALEIGFDVVDVSDSLSYAQKIVRLRQRIESAGIRVLTSCSSVSAVTAALVRLSGIANPTRVTGYIVPATHFTANRGSAISLMSSVGRPVQVWRDGELSSRPGWGEARACALPPPVGKIRGRLFETSDSIFLPAIWPSLRSVDLFIDCNVPGLNRLLVAASLMSVLRSSIMLALRLGLAVVGRIGRRNGALAIEVEGSEGTVRFALMSSGTGHFIATVPSAMSAKAIAEDRFSERGLVMPDRHVDPIDLADELLALGILIYTSNSGEGCWTRIQGRGSMPGGTLTSGSGCATSKG